MFTIKDTRFHEISNLKKQNKNLTSKLQNLEDDLQ
jgi:hypothetical protein